MIFEWNGRESVGSMLMVSHPNCPGGSSRELQPFEVVILDKLSGDSFYSMLPVQRCDGWLKLRSEKLCGYSPGGRSIPIGEREYHLLLAGERIPEPSEMVKVEAGIRTMLHRELTGLKARVAELEAALESPAAAEREKR